MDVLPTVIPTDPRIPKGSSLIGRPHLNLKETAVEYFRSRSAVYNERYSVNAAGDLLWIRHRAILRIVQGWGLPLGSRLLDLGCGPGLLTCDLARMGYCGIGLDASPAMIEHCTQQAKARQISGSWTYLLGDVEAVPLPGGSFDGVICAGVIDYLPTDDKLIGEVARVLKPEGYFLLCVTNKFGYTVSLSTPISWIESIPGVHALASRLRSVFVGGKQGTMEFDFLPRKHRPAEARNSMARHGFRLESDKYVHFSVLPAPFCTVTSKLNLGIDEKLDALDRTPLRIIGSCYILSTRVEK
jgi:ubiquinone/menaquinone biosynthesis C-methylase UbiE